MAHESGSTITVVICALNEAENLSRVLPKIPAWVDEVLLVDGHSTDDTVAVARRLRPDIRVLQQPGKGKGLAVRYGVENATGDIIVTLDADGETDPEDLPRFVQPLIDGYDFVKGSRFFSGWKNKPPHRIFGNWVIVTTFNFLYREHFTDLCSGYSAFRRDILERVDLWAENGWNFEPLFVSRAKMADLKVIEIPQRPCGRLSGQSKLPNWHQGSTAVKTVIRERFRRSSVSNHQREASRYRTDAA